MKRVLFVIPSLDYSGAARQLTLLAAGLPRERFEVRVCGLHGPAPWGEELRASGVEVATLGRTRPFDLRPFLALRRLLRSYHADIVHVWSAATLRAVARHTGVTSIQQNWSGTSEGLNALAQLCRLSELAPTPKALRPDHPKPPTETRA